MTDARGPRVLLVDASDDVDGTEVGADLEAELGGETMVRRPETAGELLRELAPTIDCVVCTGGDGAGGAAAIAEAGTDVPLVVYVEDAPAAPVDAVVTTERGLDALASRVEAVVERHRERDRLAEANEKLAALNEYTTTITGCATVEEVSDTVVEAVTNALAYGQCVLALLRDGEFVAYGHTLSHDPDYTFDRDEGIAGRTLRTGEPQVVHDYESDSDRARPVENVASVVSVPVGEHGVLQVTSESPARFDEADAAFLEIVAGHAAESLSRIEREADLRVERDRLHAFFEGMRAPVVYVESSDGGEPVLKEANAAYKVTFPDTDLGEPVSVAFPTAVERELFGERLRSTEVISREVTRETVDGERELSVGLVPVPTSGLDAAAFGLYVEEVTFPVVAE